MPTPVVFNGTTYPIPLSGEVNWSALSSFLVDVGTNGAVRGAIVNADIAAGAGIVYSKLSLTGSIVNADISASAAIAYSKLNLAGSVSLSTDVTGTLGITRGGTGQTSASAAFDALSPLTTKGDILAYGTTNARLPVGTNGFALVADSAQTLGVKWASVVTNPMTTLGDVIYGGASGAPTRLAGNTTTTKKLLSQVGDGTNSAAPVWNQIDDAGYFTDGAAAGSGNRGIVTTGTQTFGGDKTITGTLTVNSTLSTLGAFSVGTTASIGNALSVAGTATFSQPIIGARTTNTTTGTQTLNSLTITTLIYRFTGNSTVTLNGLYTAGEGTFHVITNETGNTMTINTNSGSASANDRFASPTVTIPTNNVFWVLYVGSRWYAMKPSA